MRTRFFCVGVGEWRGYLSEDLSSHVGERNGGVNSGVLDEVLNCLAHLGNLDLHAKVLAVLALQSHLVIVSHFLEK